MKVRILILSPFKYIYKNKEHNYFTGESFYLNTDIPEQRQEIEYILESEISELVYVENKPDVINKLELDKDESESVITNKEVEQKDEREIFKLWNNRKEELEQLHWQQIKKQALNLDIEYTSIEETIYKILVKEFNGNPAEFSQEINQLSKPGL